MWLFFLFAPGHIEQFSIWTYHHRLFSTIYYYCNMLIKHITWFFFLFAKYLAVGSIFIFLGRILLYPDMWPECPCWHWIARIETCSACSSGNERGLPAGKIFGEISIFYIAAPMRVKLSFIELWRYIDSYIPVFQLF